MVFFDIHKDTSDLMDLSGYFAFSPLAMGGGALLIGEQGDTKWYKNSQRTDGRLIAAITVVLRARRFSNQQWPIWFGKTMVFGRCQ